ncbi:MAG: N-acetylmuramoyl-L-alanine amidase [Segatella copri]
MNGLVKSKRNIREIIVHCSATPDGKDFTVDDIRKWHKARGFSDVGYHYIVYRDGSVHDGRSVHLVGAHCTNHNANSIGVCYIGGVATDGKTPKDTRTPQQKEALLTLLKQLKSLYPQAKIYGHRNFSNKACPSFAASREYQNI